MKKLSTEEMNRLSVGEFHRSPKLPLTVVLDNVHLLHAAPPRDTQDRPRR